MNPVATRLAVIMPTYNGAAFLEAQLQSIFAQSRGDFTLYAFDDGSSDATWEILTTWAAREPRLKPQQNPRNKGVRQNVSDALASVDADVYFLADQDDLWHPDKLQAQLDCLTRTGAWACFHDLNLVDATAQPLGQTLWQALSIHPAEAQDPARLLLKSMVTGCTLAMTKDLLQAALPIPAEALMHDHWISVVAACQGKLTFLDESLIDYRQHGNNLVGSGQGIKLPPGLSWVQTWQGLCRAKQKTLADWAQLLALFQARLAPDQQPAALADYQKFFQALSQGDWLAAGVRATTLASPLGRGYFFRRLLVAMAYPLLAAARVMGAALAPRDQG